MLHAESHSSAPSFPRDASPRLLGAGLTQLGTTVRLMSLCISASVCLPSITVDGDCDSTLSIPGLMPELPGANGTLYIR